MDDRDLVIVIPMLGRPHRVQPLLASIRAATPRARVLFALSPADDKVVAAVRREQQRSITVPFRPTGDYARKINTGYRATSHPLIFCGADDLRFYPGWLEAAIAQLRPGIGVVGTNDLGSPRVVAGNHSTHSLIVRDYADRFGTIDQPGAILHEGYPHEWVDDELVGTAKFRGAWAYAPNAKVEHLHPNWGKAQSDRLYGQQTARIRAGKPLFQRRSRLWT